MADENAELPRVKVGGQSAECLGVSAGSHLSACIAKIEDPAGRLRAEQWVTVLAYRVPSAARHEAVITVESDMPRTLHYAELKISASAKE